MNTKWFSLPSPAWKRYGVKAVSTHLCLFKGEAKVCVIFNRAVTFLRYSKCGVQGCRGMFFSACQTSDWGLICVLKLWEALLCDSYHGSCRVLSISPCRRVLLINLILEKPHTGGSIGSCWPQPPAKHRELCSPSTLCIIWAVKSQASIAACEGWNEN